VLLPFGIEFPSAMTGTNEEVNMQLPLVLFSQLSMNCLLIWKKVSKLKCKGIQCHINK